MPLQVLFAFGIAVMLTRAKAGVGLFRTVFYLPALAPPVAATLGFVYLLNPATGPVNTMLGKLGISGPLWFNDPGVVEAVARAARPVGHRQHDDHLPRRDARRAAAPVRVGRARRRRRVAAPALRDAADDQPGDPVRRRARRDPGAAVLHAGVRRCERRRRAGVAGAATVSTLELGYPEGSTLFYPVLLYYHGFRFFNMGYASAMAMLLLVVAFAVTLIIIRALAPLGALPGAAR